jgi:hypothetical protein
MLTSVVIPTHNRAGMLREAVESVLALPGPAREIVVVNDGSTDHTAEMLAGYGERLRVLHQQNGERARARNTGLAVASGEWVLFLDDDDLLLPAFVELEGAAAAAEAEVALVYGAYRQTQLDPANPNKGNVRRGFGASGWILPALLDNCFLQPSAVLVRRGVIQALGGFDVTKPPVEDYDAWLRLAAAHPCACVAAEVADVRLHSSNSVSDVERLWGLADRLREDFLAGEAVLTYARRRHEGPALAELALAAARRLWWAGDWPRSRGLLRRALRLSPARALRGMGELWRLLLPLARYRQARPGPG